MILADKIIRLRKKNGWSQEELADRMNVSRQAVSKWESSQAMPDLEKILQLSELFGVTTDYLLKDNIVDGELPGHISDSSIRRVSVEEADKYIEQRKWASCRIAAATFLCILAPITLLILGAASEVPSMGISEKFAAAVGIAVLLVIVSIAVAIYIYCGFRNSPYSFLEGSEPFELEYGVEDMIREKQKAYRNTYAKSNISAACISVLSPIPLIVGALSGNDFLTVVMLTLTMAVAGIGVFIFIVAGVRWASIQKLLKEGEYTLKEKKKSNIKETVGAVYWLIITAVFLLWGFLANGWNIGWVVFPVGGVVFAAFMAIFNLISGKNDKSE